MLRQAHEATQTDHPERVVYVAALQWPDGDTKQANFTMDKDVYAQMQKEQGENCPSWEHIVLQMMSQCIEQVLAKRAESKIQSKVIILPGK